MNLSLSRSLTFTHTQKKCIHMSMLPLQVFSPHTWMPSSIANFSFIFENFIFQEWLKRQIHNNHYINVICINVMWDTYCDKSFHYEKKMIWRKLPLGYKHLLHHGLCLRQFTNLCKKISETFSNSIREVGAMLLFLFSVPYVIHKHTIAFSMCIQDVLNLLSDQVLPLIWF